VIEAAEAPAPVPVSSLDGKRHVPFWELTSNLCGLFYMFLALMIVCDEFFVPALDVITEKTGVSPDIAGATFMAAGGSAPEFFTALVDTMSDDPSDVGIACIVGSAIFNVLFVIGMCGIAGARAPKPLALTAYPLARDSCFYMVDLAVLVYCFSDQYIQWYEAVLLFGLYIAYCVFMSQSEKIENRIADKLQYNELDLDGDGSISLEEAKKDPELWKRFAELDKDNSGTLSLEELRPVLLTRRKLAAVTAASDEEAEELEKPLSLSPPARGSGWKVWGYYILTFPLNIVMWLTIPDVRREGSRPLYIMTFCLAILWVAKFSEIMVECSSVVGEATPFDPRILGLTLIAAGTSVPDLLTSVLVTMQGHGDMAISSSIGSNIFDVTVGLPVPWLISIIRNSVKGTDETSVYVKSNPVTMIVQMGGLISMILLTVGGIWQSGWILSKNLGYLLIALYAVFITLLCWLVMIEPSD
jgi:K+-dependent Na+/Ca+ exchanger-like protein